MWVIVVVADGPMQMKVFGDADGKPFPSEDVAKTRAAHIPRLGAPYSVYIVPLDPSK